MRKDTTQLSCFTIHILLLLVAAFIPFSRSQSYEKDGNDDLIEEICKKTPFYDICTSVLHSHPLTPTLDVKGVALVMVNNLLANASDTLSYTEGLIKHTTNPQLEQPLDFCAETYIPIVNYTLPQAADAVTKNSFSFASYCISDAMKEVNRCNQKLAGLSPSPLGDRNSILQKLADVASAIIKQLL